MKKGTFVSVVCCTHLLFTQTSSCAIIFDAVKRNRINQVKSIIEKNPFALHKKNSFGWTPLHMAAKYGHKEIATFLIEKGAYINKKDDWNSTPLYRATCNNQKEMVAFLIKKGAEVNTKGRHGFTSLHQAAYFNRKEIVKLLIKKGADLNKKSEFGQAPIYFASNEDIKNLLQTHEANQKRLFALVKGVKSIQKNHAEIDQLMVDEETPAYAKIKVLPALVQYNKKNGQTFAILQYIKHIPFNTNFFIDTACFQFLIDHNKIQIKDNNETPLEEAMCYYPVAAYIPIIFNHLYDTSEMWTNVRKILAIAKQNEDKQFVINFWNTYTVFNMLCNQRRGMFPPELAASIIGFANGYFGDKINIKKKKENKRYIF